MSLGTLAQIVQLTLPFVPAPCPALRVRPAVRAGRVEFRTPTALRPASVADGQRPAGRNIVPMRRALIVGIVAVFASVAAGCRSAEDVLPPPDPSAGDDGGAGGAAVATVPGGSSVEGDVDIEADVPLPGLLDPSDAPLAVDGDVRTGTLPNGLRYYVRHNDRPGGKADLRLAVKAGSVDELGPNTGVAHFVEHMLFNGTEEYPENELIDVLRGFGASFGADVNAYTSYDETVYSLTVPNDDDSLSTGMNVLDQWLSHATFDADQVEAERGIVLDEWRTSTQTPAGRLDLVSQAMYLAGSAYAGRDPIGTDVSIQTVSRDELKAYYDAWYRPDNVGLVVVGDVDVDAVVDDLTDRFGDAVARTPEAPARPDTTFPIETEPAFALHSDPDQTTVDVEVDLPLPAFEGFGTAALRALILDEMIYDALVRRLDQDVSAGTAPFDQIGPGTNSLVPSLDAPALYAITTAERVDATLQALLDEYARAQRFGFTEAELEVARATVQAGLDSAYDSRDTVQDADYADQYVESFLTDAPYVDVDTMYAAGSAVLASVTPAALDLRFRARWSNTAPHVIVSTPEAQAASMPTETDVLAMIAGVAGRDVAPRAAARDLPGDLMAAPEPVAPASQEPILDDPDPIFDPVQFVFPNGARVIALSNDIVEGQVVLQATSPGGSSLVADADVPDALYAADILTSSGVAGFNQTELEQIIADRDVELSADVSPYTDGFSGAAAATDLETLFQLVHLYMTEPRFDPVALTQLQRSLGPLVADPSSDPDTAGYDALLDARYANQPRYTALPSPDEFATVDLDGVERVWRSRVADAGDWVFVLAGDLDMDLLADLASRYIGTLPGTGAVERWVDVSPPAPEAVTPVQVRAGTGETAALTLQFTSEVDEVTGVLRATTDVVNEVIAERLTDVIRERLGESYSPSAYVYVANDPTVEVDTYVYVTGSPDRIAAVAELVIAELADLAAEGPTEQEFTAAFAQVDEAYGFVDNGSFVAELTNAAIWPDRSLGEYFEQFGALASVDAATVQSYIADHIRTDRFVEVTVVPR